MGDASEHWRDVGPTLKRERQDRHAEWKRDNLAILRESGLQFRETPESALFRIAGKPKVDFYPSTGRWRIPNEASRRTMGGGAKSFLEWYAKQSTKEGSENAN